MQTTHQIARAPVPSTDDTAFIAGLLDGYRFRVCQTAEDWAAAMEIRRSVYRADCGYEVPVPDDYDARSWLFVAEDLATAKAVGTMRMTPSWAGTLEAEEYFTLPRHLRGNTSVEITRFAILPEYRKGKTFLPIVSLGLFKLVREFAPRIGARHLVVCSKPERIWTYDWMSFRTTGLKARYTKLNDAEHELISLDMQRIHVDLAAHPFGTFFLHAKYAQVEVPVRVPAPGFPWDDDAIHVAVGA